MQAKNSKEFLLSNEVSWANLNTYKIIFNRQLFMLWNNLSYEAKTAKSLSDFKHKLASLPSIPSTGLY